MRLHPLSIPYRAVSRSLNLGTVVLLGTVVASGSVDPRSLGFVGMVVGYLVVMLAYQTVYFRRFEYAVEGGSLDIASGVVSRRQREIPLGRVQNVDLSQNPVQRALGIVAVRIETAGGGDTEAVLKYVGRDAAERLQRDLRGGSPAGERAAAESGDAAPEGTAEGAGDVPAPAGEGSGGVAAGTADEDREVLFELPTRDLVVLSVFTIDPGAGAISSLAAAVTSGGDPENVFLLRDVLSALPGGTLQALAMVVVLVAVIAWLLSVVLTFARYYGFRLVRAGDELAYERGLLQRYSGTIPADKVQTLSVHENPLKRRFGYASLAVETAGYGPGSSGGSSTAAVPLARRDRTLAVGRRIESFGALDIERPPTRARRRYAARYAAAVALLTGIGLAVARWVGAVGGLRSVGPLVLAPPLVAFALVPVAAHYTWVHRGHSVGAEHFVARAGFWRRTTRVVPYYRIQTVADTRTAFQRRRDLATVTADTASSSTFGGTGATAIDVDEGRADDLRGTLRERLTERLRARKRRRRRRRDSTAGTGDGTTPAD